MSDLTDVLARCADLKGRLVAFGCGPRFSKALDARRREAETGRRRLDEHETITLVDRFLLQEKQEDGRSVLEAFVAVEQRDLTPDERAMMLGWSEVVDGCFELEQTETGPVLHNLFDGLPYGAHATRGPETFATLNDGTFMLGRLVPLAPLSDDWLVSGHLAVFDPAARRVVAEGAVRALSAQPGLVRRNRELWDRAWDMQARARASFLGLHGEEMLILPPQEASDALRQHYELLLATAAAQEPGSEERAPAVPAIEAGYLPEEVLAADDVAIVYDEQQGLVVCAGVGHLNELFADPARAKDRARIALLSDCLRDDDVPPVILEHLVRRHPEGAQAAFRALLGKSSFTWEADGEKLLRRYKPGYFDIDPAPSYPVLSDRLKTLLQAVG